MKDLNTLTEDVLKEIVRDHFFQPFCEKKEEAIGIELEYPVVNMRGQAVDVKILQGLMNSLVQRFPFHPIKTDEYGNILSIKNDTTEDIIAFEYSFYMLEFSMGKSKNLHDIANRFYLYLDHIQNFLSKHLYRLTGLGIHPHANEIDLSPINYQYYNMLHKYMSLVDYSAFYYNSDFFSVINSNQTHLDCKLEDVPRIINMLSKLDWINAFLFSNSAWLVDKYIERSKCICYRDLIYDNSIFGVRKSNLGPYNENFQNINSVYESFVNSCSMWYILENNKYINFKPMSIRQFFTASKINGFVINSKNDISEYCFTPKRSHIKFYKGFKDIAFTHYGTLELRCNCQQPIADTFVPTAFIIGCLKNIDKTNSILDGLDLPYTNSDLRRNVIEIAFEGLKKRGLGEETLLASFYTRADNIACPAKNNIAFLQKGNSINDLIIRNSKTERTLLT